MSVLYTVLGVVLVLASLAEAFETIVLPRRVARPYRFARLYYRGGWRLWRRLAGLFPRRRQEAWLSAFGPLSLLGLFAFWALSLVVGFAFLHAAADPQRLNWLEAFYFSGTTFTTLGYGDIAPVRTLPRMLAVLEAGTGFGYFALMIGYLPVLYQAFSRRELLIALLDARAGSPPAAGRLLLRLSAGQDGAAIHRFLEEAERWSAELLESHLSYQVLQYYRSQHGNQSWLATLTCALDTSALLLTLVEGVDRLQARLTFAMARHALVDLSLVLPRAPNEPDTDRFPDERLHVWVAALRSTGAVVRDDDAALAKLHELRSLYERFSAGLARHYRLTVPAVWPKEEASDNWQSSAWMSRAGSLGSLSVDQSENHFD